MASRRQIEESRMLLESEKAMSNMVDDDRSDRVCPVCAIMTCLKRCPKCGAETIQTE
jgi:hypothetical protein